MSEIILQSTVPEGVPWRHRPAARLPGLSPLPIDQWLIRDDVYAAQMALRDRLIADKPGDVIACLESATPAAIECLETIVTALDCDYKVSADHVTRPDGVQVPLAWDAPMTTVGRLVQCDVCLMEEGPQGHVLTAAALCFPASWQLSEKIGKPLPAIHRPVPEYDSNLEKRVQRVFDSLRPGMILTRANALLSPTAALYVPKSEEEPRKREKSPYLRTERQTLRRLPRTSAIVFGIHTTIMAIADLPEADRRLLLRSAEEA